MNSKLLERERDNTRQATAGYDRLVRDVFQGVERDPAEALDILDRAGKTAEDVERDCAWLEQRTAQIAEATKLADVRAERQAVEKQIEAEQEKVRQAIVARDLAVRPLADRLRALETAGNNAQNARNWLTDPANMPESIRARFTVAREKRGRLAVEKTELRTDLNADMSFSLVSTLGGLERELERRKKEREGVRGPGQPAPSDRERVLETHLVPQGRRELEEKKQRLEAVSREYEEADQALHAVLEEACC